MYFKLFAPVKVGVLIVKTAFCHVLYYRRKPSRKPPTYNEKSLDAKKAELTVKRITFERSEAKPSDMVYVSVPKLNKNEVIVPGSLALFFKIDLTGGHANNFLVHNVSWALMDKFTVKFAGTTLQDIVVATPTRSLKTFCSQLKTVTACCWRESKAKNFVTFA